ncbi:MAG: rhodanese-like domain-containing protein [Haloferacaceae archaeon]
MVEELTPEEVKEKLDAGEIQVIDIRDERAFRTGHIPGAENVPMNELPRAVDEIEWGDEIVCVCPVGQSSIQAAKLVESFEGVDDDARVTSMEGGYRAWTYDLASGGGTGTRYGEEVEQ